ncbi:hypothetical protein D3C76_03480 [compost metagenome]
MITKLSTAIKNLKIEVYEKHKDKIDLFEVACEMLDLFIDAYIDKNSPSAWVRARVYDERFKMNLLVNMNFELCRYVVDYAAFDRLIFGDFDKFLDCINEILVEYKQ